MSRGSRKKKRQEELVVLLDELMRVASEHQQTGVTQVAKLLAKQLRLKLERHEVPDLDLDALMKTKSPPVVLLRYRDQLHEAYLTEYGPLHGDQRAWLTEGEEGGYFETVNHAPPRSVTQYELRLTFRLVRPVRVPPPVGVPPPSPPVVDGIVTVPVGRREVRFVTGNTPLTGMVVTYYDGHGRIIPADQLVMPNPFRLYDVNELIPIKVLP